MRDLRVCCAGPVTGGAGASSLEYYGEQELCRQRARSVDGNYEETSGERGFLLNRLDGLLAGGATAMRSRVGVGVHTVQRVVLGRPSPAGPSELSRRSPTRVRSRRRSLSLVWAGPGAAQCYLILAAAV